ncbi:MAG: Uma2 family endonuclease [Prochloraceae cyanobacterium]|nr:Uma2 family endonuclease [Prochloraceae cyanobacterium]
MTTTVVIPEHFLVTHEQFEQLALANRDLKLERTRDGELIIMPPTGEETERKNAEISGQLYVWNKQAQLGLAFNSSAAFILPNGAERSPDASWVKKFRWSALTVEQQQSVIPLCPDFVIELKSKGDSLKDLQDKMNEYIDNGAQLGWLIVPDTKTIYIYQKDGAVEVFQNLVKVSVDTLLPGFELDLTDIFD